IGQENRPGGIVETKSAREALGNIFPKLGKNCPKMETFCLTPKPVLMCLVGVGKCMGAVFSKIGSARRVLGTLGGPQKGPFFE
ncbi:hypothetical protein HMPREF9989_03409, partial [Staphylococcus epidermidis NIHLM057]